MDISIPHDLSFQYRGRDVRFKLLPVGDFISDSMRRTGFFFDAPRRLGELRYIPRGASVVDVGAYIGTTAMWYACACEARKVVAIEPDDEHYDLLLANIALNNVSGVVTPVHAAVGASCGDASCVHKARNNTGGAAYRPAAGGSVKMVTLDELVDRRIISSADVLKIDVEGYECAVLDGACEFFRRYSPLLVVEVWSPSDPYVNPKLCNAAENNVMFFNRTRELGYRVIGQHGDDYVLSRD